MEESSLRKRGRRRAPRLRWLTRWGPLPALSRPPALSRRGARWLAAGGTASLAAVLGIVLAVQSSSNPACRAALRLSAFVLAPPVGNTVHSGQATFYDLQSGGGNCSYVGPPADNLFVALSPGEYDNAAACGGYLDVTGPKGKVRVKIVDQCPECATGHIDLSRAAFTKIADPVQGIVTVTYRAVVNPPLPAPLSFRIKEGASQFWFALLVIDHGNPLAKVEARSGSSAFRSLARADYNYWLADSGLGAGPFTIRLTDVYGQRVTASGIRMAPAQIQRTSTVMYGSSAAPPVQAKSATVPSRSPSARPSRSAQPTPPTVSTAGTDPAGAAVAIADPSLRPSGCG
jgi:expansin (peptidoglycan-binding protein)